MERRFFSVSRQWVNDLNVQVVIDTVRRLDERVSMLAYWIPIPYSFPSSWCTAPNATVYECRYNGDNRYSFSRQTSHVSFLEKWLQDVCDLVLEMHQK